MGLLQRLRHDLEAGFAALRYGTVQAASRALEEAERLQTLLDVRKLDAALNEIYRDIGERALTLHERGERSAEILDDPEIARGVQQARAIRTRRSKLIAESEADEGE